MTGTRLGFVWLAGVRDLRWRRRRFSIAVVATSLVFAITLLLSGFAQSFHVEVHRVLDSIHADGYVVRDGQRGPFMSPRPFPTSVANDVAKVAGITAAAPLISIIQPDTYLMGHVLDAPRGAPGWTGADHPHTGRPLARDGDVVVDRRRNHLVGDTFPISGTDFNVVGVTKGQTVLGGQPIIVLSLKDAQRAVFGGTDAITSVAVRGHPTGPLPDGFVFVDRAAAANDFLAPLHAVTGTIGILTGLLWIVASAIVGSVIYISTLERVRDLAVFKATGASTIDLLLALVTHAVLLSLVASVVAIGLSYLIAPSFPAAVSFPARLVALLPLVAIPVGVLASAAGLRRAVRVDPAIAFG